LWCGLLNTRALFILLRTIMNKGGRERFGNETFYYGVDLGTSYTVVAKIDVDDTQDGALERLPVKFIQIDQSSPLLNDTVEASDMVASIYAVGADGNQYVGNRFRSIFCSVCYLIWCSTRYVWAFDKRDKGQA